MTFSQVTSLGDGRVVVAYDNTDASHTSQFDTKIFDLRTTGLNINDGPSSGGGNNLNDGTDKYFAGTQFNDTVIGENNVNNTYYFVGQNATGQGASDTGPSDIFHGGTGGWNEAIFPDTIANYNIVGTISGNTITNIDPQQHHAGTLTVDQNVQALAFAPTHDPLPGADGSVEASGDTLLIFNPFAKAASIDAGATLEFGAADSGSVTFNSSTGILRLDSSATFSGQINGFAGDGTLSGSDQIDLRDINHSSNQFSATYNSANHTLSVTDGTNTANLNLTGTYTQDNFKFATDEHGGTIVYDPPVTNAQVSVASPTSDTFVFNPGMGNQVISNFTAANKIELDHFASISDVNQLQTLLNEAHNGQAQSLFQSANGGHDTVINLSNHDTVTVANVHIADLNAKNFIVHG